MAVVSSYKTIFSGVVLAVLMAGSAHAELKIGVADFKRLMDESPQAKAAGQVLQNEFAPRQRELQQQEKDLQAKADKLTRDAAVMSDKEVTALK